MMFVRVNAQTSFFIKPMMNNKIDFASNSGSRFDDYVYNNSPYYIYNNKAIITAGLNSIDLGLGIGTLIRKRHLLELDLNTDATGAGYRIYFEKKSFEGTYNDVDRMYIDGRGINRLSLQYSYLGSHKLHYILGLAFGYKRPSPPGKIDPIFFGDVEVAENVILSQESFGFGYNTKNIYLTVGVGRDFNYKKTYLFSLDIILNKGFSLISSTHTNITIYNNGILKTNAYASYSRGSGLYFQLSRRLTFKK
jgi:hypothetical protein